MKHLRPTPVSTNQLSYNALTNEFFAEMSNLEGFGRVYDDSIDEGFTVIGNTGREVVFVIENTYYDNEGDLNFWTLKSLDGEFTATVYND